MPTLVCGGEHELLSTQLALVAPNSGSISSSLIGSSRWAESNVRRTGDPVATRSRGERPVMSLMAVTPTRYTASASEAATRASPVRRMAASRSVACRAAFTSPLSRSATRRNRTADATAVTVTSRELPWEAFHNCTPGAASGTIVKMKSVRRDVWGAVARIASVSRFMSGESAAAPHAM